MNFLLQGPRGLVTFAWEGWLGQRAEAKYCLQRREMCSLIGRTLDSWKGVIYGYFEDGVWTGGYQR